MISPETLWLNIHRTADPIPITVFLFQHTLQRTARNLLRLNSDIEANLIAGFANSVEIVVVFGAGETFIVQPNSFNYFAAEHRMKRRRDVFLF